MSDARRLVLGIDLGTSSVKVVAVDGRGAVADAARAPYTMRSADDGRMEQDPGDWLAALSRAVADLGTRLPLDRTCALSLTGQVPCLVALGPDEPPGPAITWMDGRADAWTAARLGPRERVALYGRTGMPIDGRYIGPMYAFHYGRSARRADRVLSAKDFLYRHLTGCAWTDPSTAAGYGAFDLETGSFDPALLSMWDLDRSQVPPVGRADSAPATLLSHVADAWRLPAGIPVFIGAADSVAAVLGAGGLAEGRATLVPGSSTVVLVSTRSRSLDPLTRCLVTPHAATGWYGRETDLLSTGSSVAWLAALLGRGEDELVRAAADVPAGARGLSMAPYLAGAEQGVLWRSDLAGSVHGLTLTHGPADLMRALLEGIALEVRRCLTVLAPDAAPGQPIVVAGADADGGVFASILADVLARPVRSVALESAAGYGAALLTRLTAIDPLDTAAVEKAHRAITRTTRPDPERSARYGGLFDRHIDAFPRLAGRRAPARDIDEGEDA